MKPLVSMRESLAHDALLGRAVPGPSWLPGRVLLIANMGEALTDEEREIFTLLTGREREPGQRVEEFWGIMGRRSGKTRTAGVLAAYVAGLCSHDDYLAAGERAVIPILAASVSQASRAFQHTLGVLQDSPELSQLIEGEPTMGAIRMKTRVDIETQPASFRRVRGITSPAVICDETGFWHVEGSSNPDVEILNAVRPSLATSGGMLWSISSPHAKRGEHYGAFRRDFGPSGDPLILVAKAPSRVMNSTLPQRVVDRAYERDPTAAAAEYGAEFRSDIEAYVSREVVEACVVPGLLSRPPVSGVRFRAFCDPSGGSVDSMTLTVAHEEGRRAVVDLVLEKKPPFSAEATVAEMAATLATFGVTTVTGDRFGGIWPREAFARHGVEYKLADKTASELFQGLLPLLNSGRIELPDLPVLVNQIASLERRVSRGGGRELIGHPPHQHDDVAVSVAGVAHLLLFKREVDEGIPEGPELYYPDELSDVEQLNWDAPLEEDPDGCVWA